MDYLSLMGNNMIPYTFAIGEKYTYFIHNHYKFFDNKKTEEGTLLNATDASLFPFDNHVEKCGIDSFKTLERSHIHTFWSEDEDDEDVEEDEEDEDLIKTQYCNWNNEVIKNFNHKCVICYERDSDYIFRLGGHQYICEQCYQNKGDIDVLKCVVCRTLYAYE